MSLDPARIVRVTETPTPQTSELRDFSRVAFVTTTTTDVDAANIAALQREAGVVAYGNLDAVNTDWPTGSAVRAAAASWFQQEPYPRAFLVGVYHAAGRDGLLVGAESDESVTAGAVSFELWGQEVDVTIPSSPTATNVATAVAAGINNVSGVTGVTVAGAGAIGTDLQLTVTIPDALTTATGINLALQATGTVADTLGLSAAAGAQYARPVASDTDIGGALTRLADADGSWYWVALDNALQGVDANVRSASDWAAARRYMFGFDTANAAVLTANEETSLPAVLDNLDRERTFCFYSATRDYKAVSMMARFSSVNYRSANAVITGAHKALPGREPDLFPGNSDALADELDRKSVNYYGRTAGANRVFYGYTLGQAADDQHDWIDRRVWTDWLVESIQRELADYLAASSRVPLNRNGSLQLQGQVARVCQRGVANGGFGPGDVSPATAQDIRDTTGNQGFGAYLGEGYLVYVEPQSQADVGQRIAPPIHVWGLYRGAVNQVAVNVTVADPD